MQTTLKLTNICKTFGTEPRQVKALDNVNLEINQGELVALIGPSGSGKTTLLQIAGLLDTPTLGQIFINGVDASKSDDKTRTEIRKNHLGFIYQFHHLLPEFSALENVALPLLIQGKSRSQAHEKAKEILCATGLADRINHTPSQLSGGQQQRTAIARALATSPSLILADEPTGNLDSQNAEKIFDLLKDLTKTKKIACLLVTHNQDLANKCDKILEIKDGKLTGN